MFDNKSLAIQSTVSEVAALDAEFAPIVAAMRQFASSQMHPASAALIPAHLLPHLAGTNANVVLVLVPRGAMERLPDLLDGAAEVINETSEDLMKCETMLCIGGAGGKLRLDTAQLVCRALDDADGSFVVAVVCEESVWRRHFLPTDHNAFLDAMQAAMCGSGPNYRPYRLYTEEEIEQAALTREEQKVACTSVFTPVPLTFGARRI